MTRLVRHALGLVAFVLVTVVLLRPAAAQPPLDPKAAPEALRPWVGWVLDGEPRCPALYEHADQSRCAWPSRLDLNLGDHGGTFTQRWHLDGPTSIELPGDAKRWPMDVKVDGKAALVVSAAGEPRVLLPVGDHTLTGSFTWDSLPESLAVPRETGLLTLTLRGAAVASPNRDAQGTVFFQKAGTTEEGDALSVVVHRKVVDDIPVRVVTRIELHVSGKSREELLGKAVLPAFIPMSLDSPLPARVEPDGRVRVQVRPGVFTLELTARGEGQVKALTRPAPDGPWKKGEEVWVFEARNDYRVVSIEGVTSIDPAQTTLPDAWKRLPAYPMNVGSTMRFVESRRGDADPPPDQLELTRSLWLDFDGGGYTAHDVLTGTLNRASRLTMAAPTVLGRVAIGGRDQFITSVKEGAGGAATTGVEVRQGNLDVAADSRIAAPGGDSADLPAVGWAHDFHQVKGSLHLPPGWRLLFATGVDEVPGTWVRHWSLLELFLALMIGIVIGRLYGIAWGLVALAMLVVTLPEADAAKWCWIPLLVATALVRVLPVGRVRQLFVGIQACTFLFVAIVALPFSVEQVRQGIYPALAQPGLVVGSGEQVSEPENNLSFGGKDKSEPVAGAVPMVSAAPNAPPAAAAEAAAQDMRAGQGQAGNAAAPQKAMNRKESMKGQLAQRKSYEDATVWQSNAQVFDPAAIVQTGPGLPRWTWSNLDLRWSGPVAATQRLHLYLLSPAMNLVLALLRVALLLVVVLRVFPWGARVFPRLFPPPATTLLVALGLGLSVTLAARPASADVPDKALLDELKTRILRAPACSPTCASSTRMDIDLHGKTLRLRLEVDAAAPTAIPLPATGAQWTPSDVLVDGRSAGALARVADVLWVAVEPGIHQVVLEGPMPERASMQLALPMKPHHVAVTAVGWTVAGVHEDGLADDDLQFTRVETAPGSQGASLQPGALPPFVQVERTLHVGLDWEMDTLVTRLTPTGSAVVLEVPLLAGENVTTADVRVVGGKALVNLGPDARELRWHSVLEQKSPLKLTASKSSAWAEVWRMDIGPIWHASFSGIPFVHSSVNASPGAKIPEWRPWPGEEATVSLVRPDGVAGQTLTIDESNTVITPGLRATDLTVTLSVRSSRGGDHTVSLPEGAQLESLTINSAVQPIRQQGRKVTFPVVPGAQSLVLTLREATGISTVYASPLVDLGAPSVNATVTLNVPAARWLLFTSGPRVGPAVLFWSLLLVLALVAFALGKNRWTPLRAWHWMLLAVGLSQVDILAGVFFVGWLLALGYRARDEGAGPAAGWFNARQVVLVAWTASALIILWEALHQGLLGAPEMQVMGNGSSSSSLRWFTDRVGPELPGVSIVSVPLLIYRGAMLAWALWIVLSLLSWLKWGWGAFTKGGGWKKGPPRPPKPVPQYTQPYYPQQGGGYAQPPQPMPPQGPPPQPQGQAPEVTDPHARTTLVGEPGGKPPEGG